jgi:hypothetical protein
MHKDDEDLPEAMPSELQRAREAGRADAGDSQSPSTTATCLLGPGEPANEDVEADPEACW